MKVTHWELSKKFKVDHMNKEYKYSPESVPREKDSKYSLRFWDTNGSPNLGQTTRPSDSQQSKENQ